MSRLTKRKPSASMVLACIALFVALGGVGYAAATVRSGNIVDDAVVSADIKGGGGKTGTIKNRDMYQGIALFKGFATVRIGTGNVPRVINAGGQQTNASATTVSRLGVGRYRVVFNADPGTGGYTNVNNVEQVGVLTSIWDGAGFAAANMDSPAPGLAPTSSRVTIEVVTRAAGGNNNAADRDFTVGFLTNRP